MKQKQRHVFNQRLEILHHLFDRCLVRWPSRGRWSSDTLLTSEIAHKSRPDEPLSHFAAPVIGMVTCECDSWEHITFRGSSLPHLRRSLFGFHRSPALSIDICWLCPCKASSLAPRVTILTTDYSFTICCPHHIRFVHLTVFMRHSTGA